MNILLFGATGLTGSRVLEELLINGYQVTAVSREAASIKTTHTSLKKISGNVLDEDFVTRMLERQDAVVSTISEGVEIKQHTQSKGNGNIIKAMEAQGVKRFVCMGAVGILAAPEGGLLREKAGYPSLYLPLSYEHSKVNELLQSSKLYWTQVCPPMILPRPSDGKYLVKANQLPSTVGQVNAGNIGAFIAKELRQPEFIPQRVGITNAG